MDNMPGEHIVKSFDEEMHALAAEQSRMEQLVRDQLESAIDALEGRDSKRAKRVRKNDRQVDAINADIEERVMQILALRHPLAVDLRETVAALKIARELERIGDLAKNIAMRTRVIVDFDKVKGVKDIVKMGRLVTAAIDKVIVADKARDPEAAIEIWNDDEKIDNYCNEIFTIVLTGMMTDNSNINACTQMTFVAKNLERIGDHVTNIAASIYYVATGDHIDEQRPKADTTSTKPVPEIEPKPEDPAN